MKKTIAVLLFAALPFVGFAQRIMQNINRDWQFTPGWEVRKEVSEPVNIPHTWNLDALSGKPDYFRGLGNYLKTINIPKEWASKRVYLRFKGANQTADVYINSKHIGRHKGGYTAFCFDITSMLTFGAQNSIWVRLTNALDLGVMPLLGDFNMYGGIYRDVDLIVVPTTHISAADYASSGVLVTPTEVSQERAAFTVETTISGLANTFADVRFYVRDDKSVVLDSIVRRIKIGSSGTEQAAAMFTINNPRLWNSVIDPYMYRADVVIYSMDKNRKDLQKDSVATPFGLRYFEVDASNKFMLNGKPFRIQGVARHQDWAMLGNAIYPENHRRDVELMREMGVNMVRLSHYPQDPYMLELCDRAGIMVWSEIPFIGPGGYRDKGFNDTEEFKENGQQQLIEMIRQLYNHPSIVMWGLFNELTQRGDDPLNYLQSLNSLAKTEDPERLTVGASNQDGPLNFVTDLIGFNMYMGWYGGMPSDIGIWGEGVRKSFQKLKVGLSEYGAGGSIYQHQDSLLKPVASSYWHPEEWETHFHEQHWRVIAQKNYFWGTFVWNMFDFGAAHRAEGTIKGINDKGLVTFDRAVRKDAFYFYKANWNQQDKFVHIASRRFAVRKNPVQTFTVFSNLPTVTLVVNGETKSNVNNDGFGTFVWKDCKLRVGLNTIEAIGSDGGARDSYTVTIAP